MIGWGEAMMGLGNILGPVLGSLIYGYAGYELTMLSFALLLFLIAMTCVYLLPNSLNQADEQAFIPKSESQLAKYDKLLDGCNLVTIEEIGMCKIFAANWKAYFGQIVAVHGGQFFMSFLSIHLKKRYSIDDK